MRKRPQLGVLGKRLGNLHDGYGRIYRALEGRAPRQHTGVLVSDSAALILHDSKIGLAGCLGSANSGAVWLGGACRRFGALVGACRRRRGGNSIANGE